MNLPASSRILRTIDTDQHGPSLAPEHDSDRTASAGISAAEESVFLEVWTMTISLGVKSSFEFSPALSAHIENRINHALHAHAAHIKCVVLRLSDVNGPRHGADDKLTRIDISLNPSGNVVTSATSDDVYVSVTRAASRARAALGRRVQQLKQRARTARRLTARGAASRNQTMVASIE
jgi:putative sigma-54 modulation protein